MGSLAPSPPTMPLQRYPLVTTNDLDELVAKNFA